MAEMKLNSEAEFIENQRQVALISIDRHIELDSMFSLDTTSKEAVPKCLCIMRELVFCEDLNNQLQESDETYRQFICKNVQDLHSLIIYSSDFSSFNEATQNMKLQNLKTLQIVQYDDADNTISADFLGRCTNLQNIRLSQPAMRNHMSSILNLQTLKTLQIRYNEMDNKDDLLTEIIIQKGASIRRLQAILEEFPPRWLRKSAMFKYQELGLEELALDATHTNRIATEACIDKQMPTLKYLKNLWIIGDKLSMSRIRIIVDHCPNLERLEIGEAHRVTYLNAAIRFKQERKSPLTIVYRAFMVGNSTRIDFK